MNITDTEALADFTAAMGFGDIVDDPKAQTLKQLAAMFKCSRPAAKKRAGRGVEEGLLECITVRRDTGNGRRKMEAYRLVNGGSAS